LYRFKGSAEISVTFFTFSHCRYLAEGDKQRFEEKEMASKFAKEEEVSISVLKYMYVLLLKCW